MTETDVMRAIGRVSPICDPYSADQKGEGMRTVATGIFMASLMTACGIDDGVDPQTELIDQSQSSPADTSLIPSLHVSCDSGGGRMRCDAQWSDTVPNYSFTWTIDIIAVSGSPDLTRPGVSSISSVSTEFFCQPPSQVIIDFEVHDSAGSVTSIKGGACNCRSGPWQ